MSWGVLSALFGLGLASFIAATPLPWTSEPIFVGMLLAGVGMPLVVVAVASITNAAGSVVTYGLARVGGDRWLPESSRWRARLQAWYGRWGLWSLILAWLPGGDLLVVLAGLARAPWLAVIAILALTKTARFAALAYATLVLAGG